MKKTSTLGGSDLPVASLVAASEKKHFQDRTFGFKGYFPLTLSGISEVVGQKKKRLMFCQNVETIVQSAP